MTRIILGYLGFVKLARCRGPSFSYSFLKKFMFWQLSVTVLLRKVGPKHRFGKVDDMNDRLNKTHQKMIGMMLEHDFMIQKSICDTFVLRKRGFSGSDQMLLNTLLTEGRGKHSNEERLGSA